MTITFEQLLTDPKYREMDFESFYAMWYSDEITQRTANEAYVKLGNYEGLISKAVYRHLQKLKAESENMVFKDYEKVFDMFFKPINKPVTFTPTKPEPSIQITDQKAREICAKYFNDCNPNEIKIV